jgi:hypothetical protein
MVGFKIDDCKIIKETERAVLVKSDELPDGEMWIPQSQVHEDSEVWCEGDEGPMIITEWFAKKEGYWRIELSVLLPIDYTLIVRILGNRRWC